MEVRVTHVQGNTPLRVWADDEAEVVCLSVGPRPGEVVLGLTISGASRLLEAVRRELKVLDPAGYDCDTCLDTGHCPAARR